MSQELDALTAAVSHSDAASTAAVQYINSVAAQAQAVADETDNEAIAKLAADLEAHASALQSAMPWVSLDAPVPATPADNQPAPAMTSTASGLVIHDGVSETTPVPINPEGETPVFDAAEAATGVQPGGITTAPDLQSANDAIAQEFGEQPPAPDSAETDPSAPAQP